MAASAEERSPDEQIKMTVSERGIGTLATALQDWLTDRLGRPGQLTVSGVRTPGSGGLSSTSVLFEASWISQGTQRDGAYVARMAPEDSAVPVFPRYDLAAQFEVIGQVAARCNVPLPKLRWNEPEGGPLGTPFFVMDQVDGQIPLDNPPYVFTGWLLEAAPSERARLQRASIAVLADQSGEIFLVTGLGVYPNLGVTDAYAAARYGDRQWSVRFSDALGCRGLEQQVGGYRIEVVEPLRELILRCQSPGGDLDFDLRWTAAFPAVQEEPHLLLAGNRPILDASRFCQMGNWSGRLRVGDREFAVSPGQWAGARDRSWGIRPIGEPEPPGRAATESMEGFWWLYAPLQFESYAVIVILQENPDGYRTVNDAKRVWKDGRLEQLGWPRADIRYRAGTRHPEAARLHLTDRAGNPLTIEVETVTSLPLHVGAGYSGDPDWSHGRWMGREWSASTVYDLTDPAVAGRIPFGVIDHFARARLGDEEGWGLFEHASMGRHDPTGFADWSSVAP